MKRIGILGGTFNPIHIGHLAIAEIVAEKLGLDKVVFVPSYYPPHKSAKDVVNADKRLAMVKLAIAGNFKFSACDFEIKRPVKSYSIETVKFLRGVYPKGIKFYFIVGTDVPSTLHTWKNIEALAKLVDFVAVSRKGYAKPKSKIPFRAVETNDLGVSSSYLRHRLKKSQTVRYLIAENVLDYIKKHRLYS